MVDFRKLRASKPHTSITHPIEIFRRMPKPQGINDLYTSQADVLREWYDRWYTKKESRDFVIKLHTGGGKTLVGLLIAQAIMNGTHGPVVYLSPTNQLVEQILGKAKAYNIMAVPYNKETKGEFPEFFYNGKSVLVCTYQALFNGYSRFGTRWSKKESMKLEGIILDDAHVAFSTIRDIFTLKVQKDVNEEDYQYLTSIFRNDFVDIGKAGTFDDMVAGKSTDSSAVEVPYWSWKQKAVQVQNYLQSRSDNSSFRFVWPFLRDEFNYCHCLISPNAFVITPIFPMMDSIPAFYDRPTRIYMSATIGDDSALIRTFGTTPTAVARPIVSQSLAGVSERMILIPEFTQIPKEELIEALQRIVKSISQEKNLGIVILTPSFATMQPWKKVATVTDSDNVASYVRRLQEQAFLGPLVLANRYDGMDLAGDSCRILIMAGLPMGTNEYDDYRTAIFADSAIINYELAQRIEQGMGRGARGPNDYCVVIATGRDLVQYLSRDSNKRLLTSSTHAQLSIGIETSSQITDEVSLKTTILACIERDKGWTEYHADRLATLAKQSDIYQEQIQLASVEVKAFKLFRSNLFEEAISVISQFLEKTKNIDDRYRGWLEQYVGRIAFYWGKDDLAQEYQRRAYSNNNHLFRPAVAIPYAPLIIKSHQAEQILETISEYNPRKGFLAKFEENVGFLSANSSANQFEQALMDLGCMLGFQGERPEKQYGEGPDVLWILDEHTGMVMEAKSRKKPDKSLTKDEHGQLLNAEEWFKRKYPGYECIRVSVHLNNLVTKNTPAHGTKVLTLQKLDELVIASRSLFEELCASKLPKDDLLIRCNTLLNKAEITSTFINHYLGQFVTEIPNSASGMP